jgi:cytoskeletal protein CcmA (bactofilin family)
LLVSNATVNLSLTGNTANFSGNVVVPNLTVNTTLSGNVANFSGNLTSQNANLGNLVIANYVNVSSNVTTSNLTVNTAITGNTANFSGNVVVPNLTVNLELAGNTANFVGNVRVNNFTTNLELAGNTANFSGNVVVNNFVANGVANVGNLHVVSNVTSALTPNANLTLDLGSSTQRWQDVYAGNIDASGNLTISGNLVSNNYTANIITANTQVNIGSDTAIRHATVTTTAITANQTISTVSFAGITGVEWLVKGIDSTGSKYTVAVVTAVTDGANVDYSVFGGVTLGSSTGTLAVNIAGSNIDLQVTPSSTNSTIWTTQYRTI